MNTNLSYAPNAIKLGFADANNLQFADTLQLTPEVQKDIYYTSANRCRGTFIPVWANESQFFPSSIPPVSSCTDNNKSVIVVTDLNGNPLQTVVNTEVVGNNVQDLTIPPNKVDTITISKKDLLTFVVVGAGIFIIIKMIS